MREIGAKAVYHRTGVRMYQGLQGEEDECLVLRRAHASPAARAAYPFPAATRVRSRRSHNEARLTDQRAVEDEGRGEEVKEADVVKGRVEGRSAGAGVEVHARLRPAEQGCLPLPG